MPTTTIFNPIACATATAGPRATSVSVIPKHHYSRPSNRFASHRIHKIYVNELINGSLSRYFNRYTTHKFYADVTNVIFIDRISIIRFVEPPKPNIAIIFFCFDYSVSISHRLLPNFVHCVNILIKKLLIWRKSWLALLSIFAKHSMQVCRRPSPACMWLQNATVSNLFHVI